ncbi:MAG TPA: 4-hydroxy-tetrahydrodipicolinate reductase [Crenotrichaceae bacterium]|nr:4-hydroxy-tetrahydrodipicolinate reductase [Crenotrichaceae bacterium]
MLRVAITGVTGRMGKNLVRAAYENENIQCVAAVARPGNPSSGMDAGVLAGIEEINVTVSNHLQTCIELLDVVIDFTLPSPCMENLAVCEQAGRAIVIGTTGFSAQQREQIKLAAQTIPVILAPNMSIGVNLSFKLLEIAAKVLGESTDIEIIEAHHRHKLDAPSGTALRMGEVIARTLGRDLESHAVWSRHGQMQERKQEEIGFSVIRAGDIVGEHTVMFADQGERIEITHKATSRMTFATGAMRAVLWLADKPAGLYDMQDVLDLHHVS